MKTKVILITLLLLGGSFYGWGYLQDAYFSCPANVRIADSNGRVIDVRLISRTATHIQFTREGDEEVYVYPIRQLSLPTQLKLFVYKRTNLRSDQSLAQMHWAGMQSALQRLLKERGLLEIKVNTVEDTATQKAVVYEMEALDLKIEKLRYKMQRFVESRTSL